MLPAVATLPRAVRATLLLTGLFQGLALLAVYTLSRAEGPLGEASILHLLLQTLALTLPTALQLLAGLGAVRRQLVVLLGIAAVLGGMAFYFGGGARGDDGFYFGWTVTSLLIIALPMGQSWVEGGRLAYPRLFFHAWNNLITLCVAGIFTGLFWALLWLWASLFELIGVPQLGAAFGHRYFIAPVTGLAFGAGMVLGRSHEHAVAIIRGVLISVCRGLLPMLALIVALFALALPFTGLAPLWDTGFAAGLLVAVVAAEVALLSAVYADGGRPLPYGRWLWGLLATAVALLPVYAGLAAYGLWLRVSQYGWSESRVLGALAVAIAAAYALAYVVVFWRSRWSGELSALAPANTALAMALVVIGVLIYTPVLDPARIAVDSQVGRLLGGKVAPEAFDYDYLRFESGPRGRAALERLTTLEGHPKAEAIRLAAVAARNMESEYDTPSFAERIEAKDLAALFPVYPAGETLDEAFAAFLLENKASDDFNTCFSPGGKCGLLSTDLDQDGRRDYLLVRHSQPVRYDQIDLIVYTETGGQWKESARIGVPGCYDCNGKMLEALAGGSARLQAPRWQLLEIDGRVLQVNEAVQLP